jgi:hypothetical protein
MTKPEDTGKPESPGKSEDAPGHNKDKDVTTLPSEPEVEPLTAPTSNDVGEQTKTHADMDEGDEG